MALNPDVFGFRLRVAMNKRSTRLKKFADAIGKSENTVNKWRNGTQVPALDTVVRIAEELRVSIDFLIGRTDKMEIR